MHIITQKTLKKSIRKNKITQNPHGSPSRYPVGSKVAQICASLLCVVLLNLLPGLYTPLRVLINNTGYHSCQTANYKGKCATLIADSLKFFTISFWLWLRFFFFFVFKHFFFGFSLYFLFAFLLVILRTIRDKMTKDKP